MVAYGIVGTPEWTGIVFTVDVEQRKMAALIRLK
jgi:hypothetical protein